MRNVKPRLVFWALGILVVAASIAAFLPALDNGFVAWDDGVYIFDNPHIRGLGLENIRWMLAAYLGGLWHPITWLSLALDYRLWSLDPWGFHFTNILIHTGTAFLFYRAADTLFESARPELDAQERFAGAALAALFFAVHPLRVESVAWATERKDALSGFFLMASLLCYLRAASKGRARSKAWSAAGVASFALDMSAKITGFTFPVVLAVLEIYPLRRMTADPRRWSAREFRPVWQSILPYFLISCAAYAINIAAVHEAGLLFDLKARGVSWRVGQALYSLLIYPAKTLWPAALSPHYPALPWFERWSWQHLVCAVGVFAVVAALARLRGRWPAAAAAFACYAVVLTPMSGLAQGGVAYRVFDRYSYLPTVSFAALFGAAFLGRGRAARSLAALWLAALGAAAWQQCGVWRDTVTLWSTVVSREPSGFARMNLGAALIDAGRPREGLAELQATVRAYPEFAVAYDNLGVALYREGRISDAIDAWRRGLALDAPGELQAHLGEALSAEGGSAAKEGLERLRTAVASAPRNASWRLKLAAAAARAGNLQEAASQYAAAQNRESLSGAAENDWGLLLWRQGRIDGAVAHYRRALYSSDARAETNYNMGNALLSLDRAADAERHFRESLRIRPRFAQARVNLGNILARRGSLAEAAALYRQAVEDDPGLREAGVNLAAIRRALGRY